jgi:HlyD family secretion protein
MSALTKPLAPAGPAVPPEAAPAVEPAPRELRRRSFFGRASVLLIAGLTIGYGVYQAAESGPGGGRAEQTLLTSQAVVGPLDETLRVSGVISAKRSASLRAPQVSFGRRIAGGSQMTLISAAEPGSLVRKGDIVAEFDRQAQEQLIEDQQTNLLQAESAVEVLAANYMIEAETRRQTLREAKAEYEKAQLDLRTAAVRSDIEARLLQLAVDENRAAYEELRANSSRMLLRAPIDGIVVMEAIFRGGSFSQVSAGDEVFPGALFMQIVDPSEMVLTANVNQADAHSIRVGQKAEIMLDAYPGKAWRGQVSSVAAVTDSGGGGSRFSRGSSGSFVRHVAVEIDILESDPLIIPDLSASADVVLEGHGDVLQVPREAVALHEGRTVVLVREEPGGTFAPRPVDTGARNDTHMAILGGLSAGETVAVGSLRRRSAR